MRMNTFTHHRTQTRLRAVLFAFAGLLALQSIWIILPELIRPSPLAFPRKARSPPISSSDRNRAGRAAELALVRGDLWAEAAIAQSARTHPRCRIQKGRAINQIKHNWHAPLPRKPPRYRRTMPVVWLILASLDCLPASRSVWRVEDVILHGVQ